jgi:peptidoglycan/LPS O-acetylase OafA/YrhL
MNALWRPFVAAIRAAYCKQTYPLGYAPGLDGLRGLMTVGVLVAHTRAALAPGSILYMDIFFVMSGYFITGLLLRDWDSHRRIRFGAFYARRFARLLPPFAALIVAYLTVGWIVLPDRRATTIDAGMAFGYVMDLWNAGFFPSVRIDRPTYLGHTWSLAIEEQFYLVWPWLLAIMLRRFGLSWRLLWSILAFGMGLWVWRIWLTWENAAWGRLYSSPDTRADALMAGCALAVWLRLVPLAARPQFDRAIRAAAWPLLILLGVLTCRFVAHESRFYYYAGSVLCGVVPGAMLVMILTRPAPTILHRVFEQPFLVFLGRIFYALYLWHYPIFASLNWQFGLRAGTRALVGFPLTFTLAVLSYVLIERHFMRSTAYATLFRRPPDDYAQMTPIPKPSCCGSETSSV